MKKITLAATLMASLFAGAASAANLTAQGQLHFTTGGDGVQQACEIQVLDRVGGITFADMNGVAASDTARFAITTNTPSAEGFIRTDRASTELGDFKYVVNGEQVNADTQDVRFDEDLQTGTAKPYTVYVESPVKSFALDATKTYSVDTTVTCKASLDAH